MSGIRRFVLGCQFIWAVGWILGCGDGSARSCLDQTCSNHGSCVMVSGEPACQCDTGYSGVRCESCAALYHDDGTGACVANETCMPYTCSWHGTCNETGTGALCTCDIGYIGTYCTTCDTGFHDDGQGHCVPDSSCTPDFCSGNGTCEDVGGRPECLCDPGYSGVNCQIRGCQSNQDCGIDNLFCSKVPGNCAGTGTCEPRPEDCGGLPDETVCSCDNVTYPNSCQAAISGVNVDYAGECGVVANCQSNDDCAATERSYCAKAPGACSGSGTCKPIPQEPDCPKIWQPVCGCDDKTYDNACLAAAASVSVKESGECETTNPECQSNVDCGTTSSQFCSKEPGACFAIGVCTDKPEVCDETRDPVCGCDAQTYLNACLASAAGVSVDTHGECQPVIVPCRDNLECMITGELQYCAKPIGACTDEGTCVALPSGCQDYIDLACGCDGVTYNNPCEAAANGVNIEGMGPCPDGKVCTSNQDCQSNMEYCAKEEGFCDAVGACTPLPTSCEDNWYLVCACDGQTYQNPCEAARAGFSVKVPGECGMIPLICHDSQECSASGTDQQFCAKLPGHCDGIGVCLPRPPGCSNRYAPVCGCDQMTYDSQCWAALAGVNVDYAGVCGDIGAPCEESWDCQYGNFCAKDDGACSNTGTCLPIPTGCSGLWNPVCGCDGFTYRNRCEASQAGTSVWHTGQC